MLGRSIRELSDLSSLFVHSRVLAGDFIDSKTRHYMPSKVFPLQFSSSAFIINVLRILALTSLWLGGESSNIVLVVVQCHYHTMKE